MARLAPVVCTTLTACAAGVFAAAAAMGTVYAAPDIAKSLARIHDPVVVSGDALGALRGRSTADLRVVRVDAGTTVAIPFQFDQRDEDGNVVVDGPTTFPLDGNDELVFMAMDTGDRAIGDLWPRACDTVVEVAVVDPRDSARGWAYVLHCPGSPPLPPAEPYVVYDLQANQARSAAYQAEYAHGRNYLTGLRLGTGDGALGDNLLRQTAMRGTPTFSMLLTTIQLEFTEQNSIVEIEGVKNGPVRAVRKVGLSVDLGSLFPDLPNGTAYTYHYRTSYVTPTRFGIPGFALRILRDFTFEAVTAFSASAMPMRYWDAAHAEGLPLHAAGDAPPVTSAVDHDWWVHSNADGAMLHAFLIPERWKEWGIVRGTVLREGAAGYSLLNMKRLQKGGDYDLMQATIVLPRAYQRGDEEEPMAMLRMPLRTEIRRLR